MKLFAIIDNYFEKFASVEDKMEILVQMFKKSPKAETMSEEKFKKFVVRNLQPADPTGEQGKYIIWITKMYLKDNRRFPEDIDQTREFLAQWSEALRLNKFKKANISGDLMQYQTFEDAADAMDKLPKTEEVSETQKKKHIEETGVAVGGTELVYEKNGIRVVKLLTHEGAKAVGSGTHWCFVPGKTYFDSYSKDGPIYVMYVDGKRFAAFHSQSDQFKNEDDREIRISELDPSVRDRVVQTLKDFGFQRLELYTKQEILSKNDPELAKKWADKSLGRAERWPQGEAIIFQSPKMAYEYCRDRHMDIPEARESVKDSPSLAYFYARDVIKGRWPEAEASIVQDPQSARSYAVSILKGRWPEAETRIIQVPWDAYHYAFEVIKGRWPEAEPYIQKNKAVWSIYKKKFGLK